MNYITIDAPRIRQVETGTRLEAEIVIGNQSRIMYFEVDQAYEDCLTADRADAFLVAIFLHAFLRGESVRVNAPISEGLIYQINFSLVEFLLSVYPGKINFSSRVNAEVLLPPMESRGAVGTGVSCGIDSLATIFRHLNHECPSYRLTHLCFFDTGSHGPQQDQDSIDRYVFRRQLAVDFSQDIGLPLVEVRSNLSEVVERPFGLIHTYLNAAAALALQPLFATYLYSSGFSTQDFLAYTSDSAYFDIYLLPLISTRSLRFYSGEDNLGRFEKTRVVTSNPLSRKYLNVCNQSGPNCGRCNKCIRTLLALDALGVVRSYGAVFDLELYQHLKDSHLEYHIKHLLKGDRSHRDLHPHLGEILEWRHMGRGFLGFCRNRVGAGLRRIMRTESLRG